MTTYIPIGRARKCKRKSARVETPRDQTALDALLTQQREFERWYAQEQQREHRARMLGRAREKATQQARRNVDDETLAALLAKFEPWRDEGDAKVIWYEGWLMLHDPPAEFNGVMRRALKLYCDYAFACAANSLGRTRRCSEAHLAKYRAKIEASRSRFPKSYAAFKTATHGTFLDLDDATVRRAGCRDRGAGGKIQLQKERNRKGCRRDHQVAQYRQPAHDEQGNSRTDHAQGRARAGQRR